MVALVASGFALAQNGPMNIADWQLLSVEEQSKIAGRWSPYNTGDVQPLLDEIVAAFRAEFPHFDIPGIGNVHGSLMLVVKRPFIFDKSAAPDQFMGLAIRYTLNEPTPPGFEVFKGYFWAPENYLNFVIKHEARIRAELGVPDMSREEILAALVGKPFDSWIEQCIAFGPGHTDMVPGQRELPSRP